MTDRQTTSRRPANHARLAIAVALFGLLYSVYLLTYSGVFNSDDERYIFDTTESMVERGTLFLTQTTYVRPHQTSDVELAQPVLAIPLYFVADRLNAVGNVQTVFLFNPLVTALTAVVLYLFALDLGFRQREALAGALMFGLATISWPYAKTFFREPLATLTLLISFFALARWHKGLRQDSTQRHVIWLVAGIGAFAVSAFTKEAALVAAPIVLIYALPPVHTLRTNWRHLLILGLVVFAALALLFGTVLLLQYVEAAVPYRYDVGTRLKRLVRGLTQAGPGIAGFLVSPGKSLFVYSPVTLLAIGALFVREPEHRRERWLAIGMLVLFVVGYAASRRKLWHGGSGWGPRYMVPLSPFLILSGLPLLKRALDASRLWPKAAVALLAVAGFLVQLPGLLVNMHDFYGELDALRPGAAWTLAIWQPKYSQVLGHLRLINRYPLDLAWTRPDLDALALGVLIGGVALFAGLLAWLSLRQTPTSRRQTTLFVAISLALTLGLSSFALRRVYDDPYFNGDDPVLREMLAYLTATASPDDPIILSNPRYVNLFANYYKGDSAWYSMPRSPGERHSEEEIPLVVSDDPDELISQGAIEVWRLAVKTSDDNPLWLVVDGGPYTPWYPRPPEWWAAVHYFPVGSQEFSPTARVVEYLELTAPEADQLPEHVIGACIGDQIVLEGYDIKVPKHQDQGIYRPGDQIGLSLVWRAEETLAEDYTASVRLVGPDGQLILQQDRTPVATFRPTSTWEPDEIIRDNYGFILPPDAPPGRYEIRALMYSWPSLERLPVTSAGGDDLGDYLVVTAFDLTEEVAPRD